MSSIVIGDNQNRVKDSYAPAPVINLTLRANGEEKPMVMDSLGQFVQAGITPPSDTPTVALGTTTPGLTPSLWVAYRFVYAATQRYPLVENANSPVGKLGPRSNPSPRSAAIQTDATAGGKSVKVTVTKSNGQPGINEIWIYRTDYFSTQVLAQDAADAGNLNYVDSVIDNGSPGTIVYDDDNEIVSGNPGIETDNFVAEQMQLVLYVDPYFYGIGNFPFEADISVDANGVITLTTATDKWYDGRNGQAVTMLGITTGGFDGYGGYYFHWTGPTTGQLCIDTLGLQPAPVDFAGTTRIRIQGRSNILRRSKPRNPFSWGQTEVIDDINVPEPYAFVVGGGSATAIAVVPILNLLKIDTEGPNRTYVLNLNGAGTTQFEASKREISSNFSTSNSFTQFEVKDKTGQSYLWFLDNKLRAICQSDGATNVDVSSPVYQTLRELSDIASDRLFSHGIYDPDTQLACVWVTSSGSSVLNDVLILYHYPTDTWSINRSEPDVLCSTRFLDQTTNEEFVLVGSESGRIGRLFESDLYDNWNEGITWSPFPCFYNATTNSVRITGDASGINYVGRWVYMVCTDSLANYYKYKVILQARVSAYAVVGGNSTFTFDEFRVNGTWNSTFSFAQLVGFVAGTSTFSLYFSAILCNGCKLITFDQPQLPKKFSQFWITCGKHRPYPSFGDPVPPYLLVQPQYESLIDGVGVPFKDLEDIVVALNPAHVGTNDGIGGVQNDYSLYFTSRPATVDTMRSFRVSFFQLAYSEFFVYNYTVVFDNVNA